MTKTARYFKLFPVRGGKTYFRNVPIFPRLETRFLNLLSIHHSAELYCTISSLFLIIRTVISDSLDRHNRRDYSLRLNEEINIRVQFLFIETLLMINADFQDKIFTDLRLEILV